MKIEYSFIRLVFVITNVGCHRKSEAKENAPFKVFGGVDFVRETAHKYEV